MRHEARMALFLRFARYSDVGAVAARRSVKRVDVLWLVWIMWNHSFAGPEGLERDVVEEWSPLGSYERKDDCEQMIVKATGMLRRLKTMPDGSRGEVHTILRCYPDTFDPRGPKGK